jgi:hypothetical protein
VPPALTQFQSAFTPGDARDAGDARYATYTALLTMSLVSAEAIVELVILSFDVDCKGEHKAR